MSQIRNEIDAGPQPVDISVYVNDDSQIVFYPFGNVLANVPGNFASYGYTIDVWDGANSAVLLLTSSGGSPSITTTRDNTNGIITFTLPRATALGLNWANAKRYDIRETDPSAVNTTLMAGSFSLVARGST